MPTLKDMFLNLTGTALDSYNMAKERGIVFVDEETMNKRIDTCIGCPDYINNGAFSRCGVCGCGMKIKVRMAAAGCPVKKWEKLSPEEIDKIKNSQIK